MDIKGFSGKIMKDSLYRNSIFMIASTAIMSFFGFLFWIVAARLYSTADIGLATSLISVMGLITGLSVLGLNVGLIRYLPRSRDKSNKINTCFTLAGLASIVVSVVYLLGMGVLSPDLVFIKENALISFAFIFFMVFACLGTLIESVFIALRDTKFILIKNSLFSVLKILGLFLGVGLGAFGLFSSWMISLIVSVVVLGVVLVRKFDYEPRLVFYDSIVRQMGKYSFGNYVAGFVGGLPMMILPIMILNRLGSEMVAYYYMPMMIAGLLFVISSATTNSLFAEGSWATGSRPKKMDDRRWMIEKKKADDGLGKLVWKAVKIISVLLIPAIIIVFFFGDLVLGMFGADYAREGFGFLRILAISGIFVTVNGTYKNILKIKNKTKELVFMNFLSASLILGLSYLFLDMGLIGIGVGWALGLVGMSLIYFVLNVRN